MKLDDLYSIRQALLSYRDFASHNGDSDESGIMDEMYKLDGIANEAIDKEIHRIHLRNALARARRKLRTPQTRTK